MKECTLRNIAKGSHFGSCIYFGHILYFKDCYKGESDKSKVISLNSLILNERLIVIDNICKCGTEDWTEDWTENWNES